MSCSTYLLIVARVLMYPNRSPNLNVDPTLMYVGLTLDRVEIGEPSVRARAVSSRESSVVGGALSQRMGPI